LKARLTERLGRSKRLIACWMALRMCADARGYHAPKCDLKGILSKTVEDAASQLVLVLIDRDATLALRYPVQLLAEGKRLRARTPQSSNALPDSCLCCDDLLVSGLALDLDKIRAQPNRRHDNALDDAFAVVDHVTYRPGR
jgi:hypothetical protein